MFQTCTRVRRLVKEELSLVVCTLACAMFHPEPLPDPWVDICNTRTVSFIMNIQVHTHILYTFSNSNKNDVQTENCLMAKCDHL